MFVHGNNLKQKENHKTKYRDLESRKYLGEIRVKYDQWKYDNDELSGPTKDHKDHDFSIGSSLTSKMYCKGSEEPEIHKWDIPAVAIECKTYLDKTMLQDVSTAAEQLKQKNPNAMYMVVAEWLKLTESVNLKKFKIDQIYVLRKQKNTDREFRYDDNYVKNPIYDDVVIHLFETIRKYLTTDWESGIAHGLEKGYLI